MAINRKLISDKDLIELLKLKSSDITLDLLKKLLAFNDKNERRFNPLDELILIPTDLVRYNNELYTVVDERTTTTVGRYIMNLFLFAEPSIRKNTPYFNLAVDKKNKGKINNHIDDLLKEGKITSDAYIDYIDRMHWFSFCITSFIAYTLDLSITRSLKSVDKKKDELFITHKKAIAANDPKIVNVIEKELLSTAEEELDSVESKGLYVFRSGGSGSFGNNYKNTAVMRGIMLPSDNITDISKANISKSNLMTGIPKNEIHRFADISVLASFSRAVGTQDGGYTVKQFNASFASLEADERGTDCGTNFTLPVKLDSTNSSEYYLRYIVSNKKFILLDRETLTSYIGKTVNMRSPLYCKNSKVCNKCLGDLYYNLQVSKIGNLTSKLGSSILNKSLKRFHDLSVHTKKLDVLGSFREVE